MQVTAEMVRHAMRHWTTGVAVVTARLDDQIHGMTVNSFTSISLEPPLVSATLAAGTRTQSLVEQTGVFGVTILSEGQADISDRFAGRMPAGEASSLAAACGACGGDDIGLGHERSP